MNSARYEDPRLAQIEKIKLLADEMAKRKVQILHMGDEFKEEHVFHKIMFAQSVKHRSQIFINRNKKKMLNYFSLNKGSNDELDRFKKNLDKFAKDAKRRQSTMQEKKKNNNRYSKNNKFQNKNFAHHLSLKSQKSKNNNELKEIDEQFFNDKYSDSNFDSDNYDDNEDENDEEEEDENDKEDNKNNSNNNNDDDSDNKFLDKEKYEVKYVNPKEIKIIYDKENSPIYNKKINNTVVIKNNHKDKARYFFDKQMKLLKLKNNKIEKKRQIIEKKNQEFFQISNYLNKNSMRLVDNNPDYRPIQYKCLEEHQYHLSKIEMNENNKILKKKMEEKKEIEETIYFNKLNRKNYSQSSWEEFVEQEYYWQEEKKKSNELLRYKIKNQNQNKPNINKKSIIIFKKMNKNNNNNANNKDNIFTRLYKDQEKYDNKLKIKRQESMPTFKPYINNSKNKKTKLFKGLNNIDFNYKDNVPSNKTVKNNKTKKENFLILSYKDKNKNKTPNNNYSKNLQKKLSSENSFYINSKKLPKKLSSENSFYFKNNISKNSPLTTTNISKFNNYKKQKKKISIEYNIDMTCQKNLNSNKNKSKIQNNNINKSKDDKISIHSNGNKKGNIINNKIEIKNQKNVKDYKNNIKLDVNIKKGNIRNIKHENEFIDEELNNALKNINYLNSNLNNHDESKLLYNLNIRDNTSNSKRTNVVLTSYKYLDFFKLKK